MIFAVWVGAEVTVCCRICSSDWAVVTHAILALVLEVIGQAASRLIVLVGEFVFLTSKLPRKSGVVDSATQVARFEIGNHLDGRRSCSSAGHDESAEKGCCIEHD